MKAWRAVELRFDGPIPPKDRPDARGIHREQLALSLDKTACDLIKAATALRQEIRLALRDGREPCDAFGIEVLESADALNQSLRIANRATRRDE